MTSYTAGPWAVQPCTADEGKSLVVVSPNDGWIVCKIEADPDVDALLPPDGANARLIADAPKLLKLVDDLTAFCVAQGWKGGAITAAQAVLVKHSGDSQ